MKSLFALFAAILSSLFKSKPDIQETKPDSPPQPLPSPKNTYVGLASLKDICQKVVTNPVLFPEKNSQGEIIETHCNQAAIWVANVMNCQELNGLDAEGQYEVMVQNKSKRWMKIDGVGASTYARNGGLGFAILPAEKLKQKHGHIAAVAPYQCVYSGSLKQNVPVLANVGEKCGFLPSSECFPVAIGMPEFYLWLPEHS